MAAFIELGILLALIVFVVWAIQKPKRDNSSNDDEDPRNPN